MSPANQDIPLVDLKAQYESIKSEIDPALATAVVRNNLAYADFLSEREDLLDEADQLSAEAVRALGRIGPAADGV